MIKLFKTENEKRAERVVKNIEKMRQNSQEMRMWKNIPLAKESMELLQAIDDDEAASGMAMACDAIVQQLPEYDVPRLVLDLLHLELTLMQRAGGQLPDCCSAEEDVRNDICRLQDYIDIAHVSYSEFMERHHRHLNFDSIERTPEWEENFYEIEKECDHRLGNEPRGMGFCFSYWSTLRQVLAEHGIEWHSPSELNPRVMFD